MQGAEVQKSGGILRGQSGMLRGEVAGKDTAADIHTLVDCTGRYKEGGVHDLVEEVGMRKDRDMGTVRNHNYP